MKLGLDTGGTYTDAVLVDTSNEVIGTAKSPTTHDDLVIGLRGAASQVIGSVEDGARIGLVSLSTTLATNALVEGRGQPVALVLIGFDESHLKRARLREALAGDPLLFLAGGHDAGGHVRAALDLDALAQAIEEIDTRANAYAVCGMFAVRNPEHEIAVRDWLLEHTGKPVSCGFELSSALDAPRRALTAVLNARLIPLIADLIDATRQMLSEAGIEAPLMIVKGDGSLVSDAVARLSPVETILSGPAASVVGAQFLSGENQLVVSDMGGTTTDVALLHNGLPRLDAAGATVGGWSTMVRAVRITTTGLGGDSAVSFNRQDRALDIGPFRAMPLCVLAQRYPQCLEVLQDQAASAFINTHAGQFALAHRRIDDADGLTKQQRELWDRISLGPIPLLQLFEDQTLDRALQRLVARGHVLLSQFTPTDACHLLGLQREFDSAAAVAGASMLRRYSEQNLGQAYRDDEEFAGHVVKCVNRLSALAIAETVIAEHRNIPGARLPEAQRSFLLETFASHDATLLVSTQMALRMPVMGIGAPAVSYYNGVAELLSTQAIVPALGNVANALGAVVGSIRQAASLTITPAGGKRVQVHTEAGLREFDELEDAADWGQHHLEQVVRGMAAEAGAESCEITHHRKDNIVDKDGERVFFESTLEAVASGRPATI